MKNFIYTSIFGLTLLAQASIAQYGIKGSATDFISNEQYNDGFISDYYKSGNLGVHMACGSIADNLGNGITFNRSIFTGIDANGNLLSSKEYDFFGPAGAYQSQLNSISENSSVKFTCSGSVKLVPSLSDVLILQTDQLGNAIKARKVDFGGLDEALCTRKSRTFNSNFYYTCGKSKNMATGATNFILMRHNSDGTALNWSKSLALNVPGWIVEAEATSVIDESNTGNVIVVGNYKNANGNEATKRAFIAKLTNAGVVRWIYTFTPALYSELNLKSIRPTENPQAFVLTGSAKQNSNSRTSTVILRVKTDSNVKPTIEFFNNITTPGFSLTPSTKQEGNDVVMQNSNGIIKYYLAATSYLANGSKQAMQIQCGADGKANLVKTFVNATNSTFNAIDLVQNQASGNGVACFGSQKITLDPAAGMFQKGMLVISTLGLQTMCSELSEVPSSTSVSSTSSAAAFSVGNNGFAEDIGFQSTNGQIYSTCWTPGQLSGARFDDGSEEDVVSTILPGPTLYPNPVAGTSTTLVVHAESNEKLQVNIFDMHGRLMLAKSIMTQQGENQIELDLGTMEAGIYSIVLQGKEQANRFIKFVKQ
ncbi:MAG: T9SS type A sorting domain-containing protein [Bacteroidia bacterium]|jgi:hypothetical protein